MENNIITYTGKIFNPLDPKIEDIDIEDIAHSLSMQCRFNGHIEQFYSIAQHSVLVSYVCEEINSLDALSGLLHDASEAYICDIPSPIKKTQQFAQYREVEDKLQSLIYNKFSCPVTEPTGVKTADHLLLKIEMNTFLNARVSCHVGIIPLKIESLSPKESKILFMNRFYQLSKGM